MCDSSVAACQWLRVQIVQSSGMGTIQEELRSHIMRHMRRMRVGKRGATQAVHDGAVVRGIVPRNECWALRHFIPFQGQCGRSPLQCASFLQNSQNTSVCYPKTWTSKDETPNTSSSWLTCKRSIQLDSFVNDIVKHSRRTFKPRILASSIRIPSY